MVMTTRGFRILGAVAAVWLPACGGGGHGSGGGAGTPAFTVSLSKPSAGQTFTAPATIPLSGDAVSPVGSIVKMEFLQGFNVERFGFQEVQSVVATSTESPFQAAWTDVPAGIYTLVARATDALGTQRTSTSVTISVVSPGVSPGAWLPIARLPGEPSRFQPTALSGIWFVDADRGWVVGTFGAIWHTGDGGATWVPQSSGTSLPLLAVQFVDADRGWAVGGDFALGGIVLRTTDGGATWSPASRSSTRTRAGSSETESGICSGRMCSRRRTAV